MGTCWWTCETSEAFAHGGGRCAGHGGRRSPQGRAPAAGADFGRRGPLCHRFDGLRHDGAGPHGRAVSEGGQCPGPVPAAGGCRLADRRCRCRCAHPGVSFAQELYQHQLFQPRAPRHPLGGAGCGKWIAPRPKIDVSRCIGCGKCAEICPGHTIREKGKAHIDPKGCIRCFCCHEMCPVKAIEVKRFRLFQM